MQDAIRQGKILSFFPNDKERNLCKKKRRVGEKGENEGRKRGERGEKEGGMCLTFFKGIINSECSCSFINSMFS